MTYGQTLRLRNIPMKIQELVRCGPTADVIYTCFTPDTAFMFGRPGVRFETGKEIELERLGNKVIIEQLFDPKDDPVPTQWNPSARDGVPFSYLGQMPDGVTVI